jgi:hypothetical protein
MTDSEIMQDLFDTFEVTNKLNAIVGVENFLAARHALLDLGPKADTPAVQVMSCCKMLYKAIGPRLFKSFVTLENVAPSEGLDDVWSHWCPLPPDVELHKQDYPAGTLPLWSNGSSVVFARLVTDKHGNEEFDFAVTK